MVGVYSPTLSPWLAWTSYGLGAGAGRRQPLPGTGANPGIPVRGTGEGRYSRLKSGSYLRPSNTNFLFIFDPGSALRPPTNRFGRVYVGRDSK